MSAGNLYCGYFLLFYETLACVLVKISLVRRVFRIAGLLRVGMPGGIDHFGTVETSAEGCAHGVEKIEELEEEVEVLGAADGLGGFHEEFAQLNLARRVRIGTMNGQLIRRKSNET